MINAKKEFLEHTQEKPVILCVNLHCRTEYDFDKCEDVYKDFILPLEWHKDETKIHTFLESLDFEYDESYGCQNLFGTIWYVDGTWSERHEYDGSEWWLYQKAPEIPEACHV